MPKRSRTARTRSDDRYLDFIKTVHLAGTGIDKSSFSIDREKLAAETSEPGTPSAQITGRHEIAKQDAGAFVVLGHYDIRMKSKSGAEVGEISCILSALFSLDAKAEQTFIQRFAENEARFVFWPNLRHYVADCTYRMGITPMLLPLTSEFSPPQKEARKSENSRR